MGKRKHKKATSSNSGSSLSDVSTGKIVDSTSSKNTPKKAKVTTSTPTSVKETLSKFVFRSKSEEKMAEKDERGDNGHMSSAFEVEEVFSPELSTSKSVSNEDLMRKLCANGSAIARLTSVVDELKAALLLVQNENDQMKKELDDAKKREDNLKSQITEARHIAEVAERKAEDMSAYIRRNNLRIYGLKEEHGETAQQCEDKVLAMINNKLKVKVKSEDVEAVHRVGAREQRSGGGGGGDGAKTSKSRAIIMRFVSRRTRDAVLYARKSLKGSGTVLVEDLTPRVYSLLSTVKSDSSVCQQAWTKNGVVWMKTTSGRIVSVKSLADFRQFSSPSDM